MTIELRRLEHADINLLRELRNASADAFFDDSYITKTDQEEWWYKLQRTPLVQFYTIWLNSVTSVGFLSVIRDDPFYIWPVRFDIAEIGNLLLVPAYRGQGVMSAALTEVRRLYSPLTFWVAHVKSTNTASLKVFARQQFIQLDPTPTRRQKKVAILEAR